MCMIIEMIGEPAMRGGGAGLFAGCAAGGTAMAVVIQAAETERAGPSVDIELKPILGCTLEPLDKISLFSCCLPAQGEDFKTRPRLERRSRGRF